VRILIAGASGFVGSAVMGYLASQGHNIVRLVRHDAKAGEIQWDPDAESIDEDGLEGFDSVVHVAALPSETWTPAFKEKWYSNRVGTSRLLASSLAKRKHKPKVLICASGETIYSPSNDQLIDEDSQLAKNFVGRLHFDGEAACTPALDAGIRVVHLRFPTILGGSTLKTAIQINRDFESGEQWMSWVSREDVPRIVDFCISTESLAGPVNAASPNAVKNRDFVKILSNVINKEPGKPISASELRQFLGEAADDVYLVSRRLTPRKLIDAGYHYCFTELEAALRHEVGLLV
jgi:uncharacterized protein